MKATANTSGPNLINLALVILCAFSIPFLTADETDSRSQRGDGFAFKVKVPLTPDSSRPILEALQGGGEVAAEDFRPLTGESQLRAGAAVAVRFVSRSLLKKHAELGQLSSAPNLGDQDKDEMIVQFRVGQGDEKGVLKVDAFSRHWPNGNPYLEMDHSWELPSYERLEEARYWGIFGAESLRLLSHRFFERNFPIQYAFDDLILTEVFKEGYSMQRVRALGFLNGDIARMRRAKGEVSLYGKVFSEKEQNVLCELRGHSHTYQKVAFQDNTLIFRLKICGSPYDKPRLWTVIDYRFRFDSEMKQMLSASIESSGNVDAEGKVLLRPQSTQVVVDQPLERQDIYEPSLASPKGLIREFETIFDSK